MTGSKAADLPKRKGWSDAVAARLTATRQRSVLTLAGLFWLCTFGVLSVRAAMIEKLPFAQMAPRRALVALCGALLCVAAARIFERLRFPSFLARAVWAFAAAGVMAVLVTGFHLAAYRLVTPLPGALPVTWWEALQWVTIWLGYFLAWTGTYLALLYHWDVRERDRQLAEVRALAQEAQLAALRSQINPHFLFNALNSISSLVLERRIADAEKMLLNLAAFFRATLSAHLSEPIELAEEIELQQLYLGIEGIRFSDRMLVEIDVPAAAAQARVPALILQPLVENAIRHGVGRASEMTRIRISARTADGMVQLAVEDDAASSAPGEAPARSGLGLLNVAERLRAHYHGRATLQTGRRPQGGYAARIELPLEAQ